MCARQPRSPSRRYISQSAMCPPSFACTLTRRSLDSTHQPELIRIISTLLKDQSPLSIGSVAIALDAVCPTRLDLLHQHYRRLCRTLIDMDEWGQVDLLNLLVRYTRVMLPRPIPSRDVNTTTPFEVDSDLTLLLTSVEPLFQSQNPAVGKWGQRPSRALIHDSPGCPRCRTGILLPWTTV